MLTYTQTFDIPKMSVIGYDDCAVPSSCIPTYGVVWTAWTTDAGITAAAVTISPLLFDKCLVMIDSQLNCHSISIAGLW